MQSLPPLVKAAIISFIVFLGIASCAILITVGYWFLEPRSKPRAAVEKPSPAVPNINDSSTPTSTIVTPVTTSPDYKNLGLALNTLTQTKRITVTAGVGNESSPYSSLASDGRTFDGFEIKLINEIEKRWKQQSTGLVIEFKGLDITDRRKAVMEGRADFALSALSKSNVNCTEGLICTRVTHLEDELKILVPVKAQFPEPTTDTVLCGYFKAPNRVGVVTGTVALEQLRNIFIQCPLREDQPIAFSDRTEPVSRVAQTENALPGYITFGRILHSYSNARTKIISLPRPFPVSLTIVLKNGTRSQGVEMTVFFSGARRDQVDVRRTSW
ncbi:MAG: transporter substrate-binding domain-containing protein [Candidatus Tectimicrobiota bacterium]